MAMSEKTDKQKCLCLFLCTKVIVDDSRVDNPRSAGKVSLSVMRAGSLPLNLHYPPVSQKPNTYNQLEAAPALRFPLLCPRHSRV